MRITALAGGVGGARFLRGLRNHLDRRDDGPHELTIVANTGDDITLFGLRVSPDVDTLLYTLGGAIHEGQGWGRAEESFVLQHELAAYGLEPQWFGLGDKDLGTHVARSMWLAQGASPSQVTDRLAERWGLPGRGVRIIPMTDHFVETHVVVDDQDSDRAIHFQEWWIRHQAAVPAKRFVVAGMDQATAAPGVLEAIRSADVVLLPPSNPVVSIGIILLVPGVRDALRGTSAPVVGVSPIIGDGPVRGHADACLRALGVEVSATAVASLYRDFLDGWLVDSADHDSFARSGRPDFEVRSRPLLMQDLKSSEDIAASALQFALERRR